MAVHPGGFLMDWEQRLLLLPSSRKEHPFYCPLLVLGYSKFEVHFVLNACFLHHCKFEKNEWNHSKSGTVCIQLLFVNHTSIKLGQKGRQAQSFLMQEIKCTLKNTQVKLLKGFPVGSDSKESTWNAGHLGSILGQEDPLEEDTVTPSSILTWRIPWTEEPSGLQSLGSQRVRHD